MKKINRFRGEHDCIERMQQTFIVLKGGVLSPDGSQNDTHKHMILVIDIHYIYTMLN